MSVVCLCGEKSGGVESHVKRRKDIQRAVKSEEFKNGGKGQKETWGWDVGRSQVNTEKRGRRGPPALVGRVGRWEQNASLIETRKRGVEGMLDASFRVKWFLVCSLIGWFERICGSLPRAPQVRVELYDQRNTTLYVLFDDWLS